MSDTSTSTIPTAVPSPNQDFPVPVATFVKTLAGTEHEVFAKLLQARYAREKHTPAQWHALIQASHGEPAFKANPSVRV